MKNVLGPSDRHLSAVETDDLYDNVIHSAMESALCAYLAKKRNKALRKDFGAQEKDPPSREMLEAKGLSN